jgi:hypothetical protein
LSALSVIGIGGVLGASFTYFWQKRKEIQLKQNELKEKRYLCILLLMYAYVNPKEFKNIKRLRPEIQSRDDLKGELQTEWVNCWIYASDETIGSFKKFLEEPTEDNFAKTVLYMRQELWNKPTKLPLSVFSIKSYLK